MFYPANTSGLPWATAVHPASGSPTLANAFPFTNTDSLPLEIDAEWVKLDLPKEFITIKTHLEEFQVKQIKILKMLGFALTENKRYYNKFRLLEMQSEIRKRIMEIGRAHV